MTADPSGLPRGPLSGRVIIEWVDAAEPTHVSEPPNFGWSIKGEPQMDDVRLSLLLREIADSL